MYTGSDSDTMANENKKKNKKQSKTKKKIKNECAFLYLLANNKCEKWAKHFLCYFTNSMQYTLQTNNLAEYIPDYNMKKN